MGLQGQALGPELGNVALAEVHRRGSAIWDRLDYHVRKDYRQHLQRQGDKSGRMLALLLKHECPPLIILALHRPDGALPLTMGQIAINIHLHDHLVEVYASPAQAEAPMVEGFIAQIDIHKLTEAQADGLQEATTLVELG
ncbi:hypothetical protein NDU88_004905 [Pleurodeles waltl]|uniref:Uncharacterized protein n=1 Tax=Pleurodeles waltl TaxID=8319 RepID=A0AAV7WWS2_PLEWA|nr:hypothetical protein NDU88_004905 [Pleurodeles waltl]